MDRFWSLPRFPFRQLLIEQAPENAGVYALLDGEEFIYIGGAAEGDGGIRGALLAHLRQRADGVTAYSWEIHRSPRAREAQLLAEYQQQFARLPRWHTAA